MNVKPGDIAVMVRSPDYPQNLGRVCLVLKRWEVDEDGDHNWLCKFPSPISWFDAKMNIDVVARAGMVPDAWLRPIRDPGDDAKDESLLWKPVPKEGELTKDEADLLLEALRELAETVK